MIINLLKPILIGFMLIFITSCSESSQEQQIQQILNKKYEVVIIKEDPSNEYWLTRILLDASFRIPTIEFTAQPDGQFIGQEIIGGTKKTLKGTIKNKRQEGEWTFDEEEQIKVKTIFKNGLKEGKEQRFSKNGVLEFESHYRNGKLDGQSFLFLPNGEVEMSQSYANGKTEGLQQIWYSDNGKVSGKKREAYFKDGEETFLVTRWYPNGHKFTEGKYVKTVDKTTPIWTVWYENGQKKIETLFNDDERMEGKRVEWYENGQKKCEGLFNRISKQSEIDTWIYWDEEGNKIDKGIFKAKKNVTCDGHITLTGAMN